MKTRIFKLRLASWRLYIANCRMKKMSSAGVKRTMKFYGDAIAKMKRRHYKQNGGCCDHCGRKLKMDDVQLHHILPYAEFPQYGLNPANVEIVCDDCHHTIHQNPYANLRHMEQKAQEFGFDLITYFEGKKN